jgi:CubicO group peptidase (beta-lactamase class C family)
VTPPVPSPGRVAGGSLFLGLALAFFAAPPRPRPSPVFAALDSAIAAGIRRGIYPGAVVVVGRADTILHARGFGRLSWSKGARLPRPDSTLYDLASLTKVVATTSAALVLVDRGELDIDAPVSHYLPEFSLPSQRRISVRMLLDHTSGLRPYADYFKLSRTRQGVVALLMQEEPRREPGDSAVYSDLNAMLLGLVIESITGESLNRFVTHEVFQPLDMIQTGFLPPASRRSRIAPGYRDGHRLVAGVVQDMNARSLGGVSGHAGLFGTGRDLARYAQWWLHQGTAAGSSLVASSTMRQFLEHHSRSGARLLGWDSPDLSAESPGVFGSLLSPQAYGHTGWTGTQIWIDPDKNLFVVLLTNRSLNPRVTRSIRQLRSVRAQVADAAVAGARVSCLSHRAPGATC